MKAIVNTAVCPLKAEPKWECTLVDEVLYGMVVDILEEPAPGWAKVRTQYRYEGFAPTALLRIGGDSFTLEAINDNLKGCGLNAVAVETDTPGVVEVYFPDVPGIPDGFDEMKKILEDILPSHLEIQYKFWYITWALMEERFDTWGDIEAISPTWEELEKMVQEDEAG